MGNLFSSDLILWMILGLFLFILLICTASCSRVIQREVMMNQSVFIHQYFHIIKALLPPSILTQRLRYSPPVSPEPSELREETFCSMLKAAVSRPTFTINHYRKPSACPSLTCSLSINVFTHTAPGGGQYYNRRGVASAAAPLREAWPHSPPIKTLANLSQSYRIPF